MRTIDLICLGSAPAPCWAIGQAHTIAAPTPQAVARLLTERLVASTADAWLFWDSALGAPAAGLVRALLDGPGDAWHAGLRLGTGGLPGTIDFVSPTWMHNCDPPADLEATSWRMSLRAALIRTSVLRALGGPRPEFTSLDAAALELGHRLLRRGAIVRHVPSLLPENACLAGQPALGLEDELRFVQHRFGRRWLRWAVGRALASGYARRGRVLAASRRVAREAVPPEPPPLPAPPMPPANADARVTVLIPTIERYPYLYTVLRQLRAQTVRPHEVVVVDQTPRAERDLSYRDEFADLALTVIEQDEAGQCVSRNAGLQRATGDYVLFIDDDDEIEPDLIERHLAVIAGRDADASSGVADEVGAGPLPAEFTLARVADVFPTNNTLVRRSALERSGLFDLAYNRGQRADGDLGMRVYLSGALMLLSPNISVLHHHAPRGGLRVHKARVITYASSRRSLTHRHLPSASEIYLMRRYFTPRQVREALWMRVAGTLTMDGTRARMAVKLAIGVGLLPSTLRRLHERGAQAAAALERFPIIPSLKPVDVRPDRAEVR